MCPTPIHTSFANNNNINSSEKLLKQYLKVIKQSIQNINEFTNNLDNKVTHLLKTHQQEFVQSYQTHMKNLKNQLIKMQKQLNMYKQQIKYYQNQGNLSNYIKKVNFLENQQTKILKELNNKNGQIKQLKLQLQIRNKEQQYLNDRIKSMIKVSIQEKEKQIQIEEELREKLKQKKKDNFSIKESIIAINQKNELQTALENKIHYLNSQKRHNNLESIQTFSTEVPTYNYILPNYQSKKQKLNVSQDNYENRKIHIKSEQQSPILRSNQYQIFNHHHSIDHIDLMEHPLKEQIKILEKENHHLKNQIKKLISFNCQYASNLSQLGAFFIKSVEQLKKNIINKRKLNTVTFDDFKKQDKIAMLSNILSNQTALVLLYDKIFKPDHKQQKTKPHNHRAKSVLAKSFGKNEYKDLLSERIEIMDNPQHDIHIIDRSLFPKIKNHRFLM